MKDTKSMNQTATEIIKNEIMPVVTESEWESPKPGEEHYSTNQIIAAYEAGVAKGLTSAQELVRQKFYENVERTAEDTGKLISKLQEFELPLISARLKVVSWDQFEVLILLPEKEYLSKKFEPVYDWTGELENASRSDYYSITFCFCPVDENVNMQKIKSDGFTLQHKALAK